MNSNLRVTELADGIQVVIFDRPGSAANVFDRATLYELRGVIDRIRAENRARGVIFQSAKPAIFIAGADLRELGGLPVAELRAVIELGQQTFQAIASLPMPTVAAIHGACLGGGFELALACTGRVASDSRRTKLGLPETSLGLIPAWGGSTRLPRLIGLPQAMTAILTGKQYSASHARKLGLVDEVVPAEILLTVAQQRIHSGRPKRHRHWGTNNRLAAELVARRARASVAQRTRGHYPAATAAVEVVSRSVSRSVPASLAAEAQAILGVARTDVGRQLIRLFSLREKARKLTLGIEPTTPPPRQVAVIGAGVMGAGIAQWLSARGLSVILRDINAERVAQGLATIRRLYEEGVRRRVFTPVEARAGLDRIQPAANRVPLNRVDLVIEAATENLPLKRRIFTELGALVGPETLLATNTSALPVGELGHVAGCPGRVVGLHFFNPVHRLELVEVVQPEGASQVTIERAIRFVQAIGKVPVLVGDAPGFVVNRVLLPYLVMAGQFFEQGVPAEQIDEAMLEFGMPMGPLRLIDEIGTDTALHVAEYLAGQFADRLRVPAVLRQLVADKQLGRKSGAGFYRYGRRTLVNPLAQKHVARATTGSAAPAPAELPQRLLAVLLAEAERCLAEGVIDNPDDLDLALVLGTGFAPYTGGPMQLASHSQPADTERSAA